MQAGSYSNSLGLAWVRNTSEKLVERSRRTVMTAAGVEYAAAAHAITAARGSVKTAIVMLKLGCTREEAEARLGRAGGFVRAALASGPVSSRPTEP